MAILKPFKAAPAVPIGAPSALPEGGLDGGAPSLDGYDLVCTEAGRSDHGLVGVVVVKNGAFATDPQEVRFTSQDSRAHACAKLAAQLRVKPKLKAAQVEAALRALYEKTEITLQQAQHAPDAVTQTGASERYSVQHGRISRRGADGWLPLCNFAAHITEHITRDDGAEERGVLTIGGTLSNGQPLGTARVQVERFAGMTWPLEKWGVHAVVEAGQGAKDHLRAALQALSPDVVQRRIYTHTGWRLIGGVWYFLHAGGAIGPDGAAPGIDVELEGRLTLAALPAPAEGDALCSAVACSIETLGVGPDTIMVPLLGAAYRAPLIEALSLDASMFAVGPTGGLKTSVTALVQAHFGAGYNDRVLPSGWTSTGNSLEKMAFLAKDIVFVVDDFAPTGTTRDVDQMHALANRVLRAVGNQAGRARMRADTSLRPDYSPRCALLTSGEDVPRGHSLGARLLVVPVAPGDIALERLGVAQQWAQQGVYAAAMSGYVRWLAARYDLLKTEAPARFLALRDAAQRDGVHLRLPATEAHLRLGWESFLRFAVECGAITPAKEAAYLARVQGALHTLAAQTQAHVATQDAALRFVALLGSALATGQVHLTDKSGLMPHDAERWGWRSRTVGEHDVWEPRGAHVGWRSEDAGTETDAVWLEPEAAYAAIRVCAQRAGGELGIGAVTLWKRLRERGLLAAHDQGRNTARRAVGGQKREVVALHAAAL